MLKVTWRTLVARKLRLLLSAFAIVLGVAFVAGSLVFTDAIGGAFDDLLEGSTADVEVAPEGANTFESVQDDRTLSAPVVAALEELPETSGVHPVAGLQNVYVVGDDGKVVGGNGPPGLASTPTAARSLTGGPILTVVDGELPDGPEEIALDVDAAEKAGHEVGDTVEVVTPGAPPQLTAELTGTVELGGGLNGATLTVFDTAYAQERFFGGRDVYTEVALEAAAGVSQEELAAAAQEVLPPGVEAVPGDEIVAQDQESIDEVLGFVQTFLLVFAAVSLVVGVFLIINTFSILVAQRSRELALLRAMGASRGQVNRSVLLEALVVGLIGSTVGLGAGYLLALGLRWVFGRLGLDLSGAEFPVEWTTVAAAYGVGVVVTVVAGYLPARRASRVAPVAALRDDVALPEQTLRRRALVAAGLLVLGAASLVGGFVGEGGTGLSLIGLGMLLVLVGVALLSPLVARPVIRVFEVAYRRLFGTVGVLATQNALRNPRRTAATASALMIGMALVAMMSILGRSASASTEAALDEALTSQFIITSVTGQQPFSTDVAERAREVEGVQTVTQLRQGLARVEGDRVFVGAVDPRDLAVALLLPVRAGDLADLGPGTVVVSAGVADRRGLAVGDPVTLAFQGGDVDLRVAGVLQEGAPSPSEWYVTYDTFRAGGLAPLDSLVFVNAAPDADLDAVRADLRAIVADLPTVTVQDPQGFVDAQKEQIDQFLNLIYALLGLSVVIAVLGVVNTLALSVIERTREVGLLRAVGVSRRQLRTVIRLESIVIAVFGALLGIAMGVAFGVGLMVALEDQGLTEIVVPWGSLALFVLAAAFVGVVAAVVPARRAARLDVLRAITTQ